MPALLKKKRSGSSENSLRHIVKPLRKFAVSIDSVVEDVENTNTHNEASVQAIADSLTQFKQRQPIVVRKSDKVVVAGNGRLLAAKFLGWKQIAAVFVSDSRIKSMEFAITDNRTATLSEWDWAQLKKNLADVVGVSIKDDGFVVGNSLPGFADDDIREMFDFTPNTGNGSTTPKQGQSPDVGEVLPQAFTDEEKAELQKWTDRIAKLLKQDIGVNEAVMAAGTYYLCLAKQ